MYTSTLSAASLKHCHFPLAMREESSHRHIRKGMICAGRRSGVMLGFAAAAAGSCEASQVCHTHRAWQAHCTLATAARLQARHTPCPAYCGRPGSCVAAGAPLQRGLQLAGHDTLRQPRCPARRRATHAARLALPRLLLPGTTHARCGRGTAAVVRALSKGRSKPRRCEEAVAQCSVCRAVLPQTEP